jgi:hypothetical protein
VAREFAKVEHIGNLLVSSVLEFGMVGPYKYYLVRLRNSDKVYIR